MQLTLLFVLNLHNFLNDSFKVICGHLRGVKLAAAQTKGVCLQKALSLPSLHFQRLFN